MSLVVMPAWVHRANAFEARKAALTSTQLAVLEDLEIEGAYIRELSHRRYELSVPGNAKKTRTVYRTTVDRLVREKFLILDRRAFYSRQHAGYFLRNPY